MERECTAFLIICPQDKQKHITAFTCYTGHLANSVPLLKQQSSVPVTAIEAPGPCCIAEGYTASMVLEAPEVKTQEDKQGIHSTPPSQERALISQIVALRFRCSMFHFCENCSFCSVWIPTKPEHKWQARCYIHIQKLGPTSDQRHCLFQNHTFPSKRVILEF